MAGSNCDYRVIILPSSGLSKRLKSFSLSGDNTSVNSGSFLFDEENGNIYEIVEYSEDKRSWFVDDIVIENGSLLMITRVDALFIILPHLMRNKDLFKSLQDILVSEKDVSIIMEAFALGERDLLSLIADVKVLDDELYYRVNEEKLIKWLKTKVNRIIKVLKTLQIDISRKSTVIKGFTSGRKTEAEEKEYISFAVNLLSRYLDDELLHLLLKAYKINIETYQSEISVTSQGQKRLASDMNTEKREPNDNYYIAAEDKVDSNKKQKLTRSQKELEQASKKFGLQSISAFFSKKPIK